MMQNKICLITGSTDGIGLETAFNLAHQGATVILHGRNQTKGESAVKTIKQKTGNENITFLQADFASLSDVRELANTVIKQIDQLDILINNAGQSSASTRRFSQDGYEMTFAVNHLAPFLLTNLLTETLVKSPAARVITVASIGHKFTPFDIDDLMSAKTKPINAYLRSKFANILFSNELSRRLKNQGVTANCLHPGVIRSNFGKESLQARIFYTVARPFLKTVTQGAETIIYLACAEGIQGKSGGYYINKKLAQAHPDTNDPELAQRLWQLSEELVNL